MLLSTAASPEPSKTSPRLKPAFADTQTKQELVTAQALYSTLTQIIRLCLTGPFDRSDVPPGLKDLLLNATDLPDFSILEAHLKETERTVRQHFDALMKGK